MFSVFVFILSPFVLACLGVVLLSFWPQELMDRRELEVVLAVRKPLAGVVVALCGGN
jgi:hypothetical protein